MRRIIHQSDTALFIEERTRRLDHDLDPDRAGCKMCVMLDPCDPPAKLRDLITV
jgi:hypothetical protein